MPALYCLAGPNTVGPCAAMSCLPCQSLPDQEPPDAVVPCLPCITRTHLALPCLALPAVPHRVLPCLTLSRLPCIAPTRRSRPIGAVPLAVLPALISRSLPDADLTRRACYAAASFSERSCCFRFSISMTMPSTSGAARLRSMVTQVVNVISITVTRSA